MSVAFTVIQQQSGKVLRWGRCAAADIHLQAGESEIILEATPPAGATHWNFGSEEFETFEPEVDLPALKAKMGLMVDQEIERRRQSVVTPGTVMQLIYGMKQFEATNYMALAEPPVDEVAAERFPLLAKEAEFRGVTIGQMAEEIQGASLQFRAGMGDLEVLRYSTKEAIVAAETEDAARSAAAEVLGSVADSI
jgi:hypothetical protein